MKINLQEHLIEQNKFKSNEDILARIQQLKEGDFEFINCNKEIEAFLEGIILINT